MLTSQKHPAEAMFEELLQTVLRYELSHIFITNIRKNGSYECVGCSIAGRERNYECEMYVCGVVGEIFVVF